MNKLSCCVAQKEPYHFKDSLYSTQQLIVHFRFFVAIIVKVHSQNISILSREDVTVTNLYKRSMVRDNTNYPNATSKTIITVNPRMIPAVDRSIFPLC